MLLEGALGVGKTVVAELVAQQLERDGWRVEVCVATAPEVTIPFGAFSRFLPSTTAGDFSLTLEQASRRVMGAAAGGPLVLLVDDVHHLDTFSLALVSRLVRGRELPVLLTHRAGEALDTSLIALEEVGLIERIEVPPLDRASHDSLLATVLGAGPAACRADRFWVATQGNPLFLRELVAQLRERGDGRSTDRSLDDVADIKLAPSPLLTDIVQARVSDASEGAREALEYVAMAAPIRLDVLLRLSDRDDLAVLEASRLVAVANIGGHVHVIPDHPIYGEVIRAALPPLRRIQLANRLADVLVQQGLGEHGETLEAVRWLIEANRRPPSDLATRAAGEALAKSDAALAEQLVRAAGGPFDVEALVVLGTALSVQNRQEEARATLTEALKRAAHDAERVSAALALARHLVWMEREFDAGTKVLMEAIKAGTDGAARAELRAELAICLAVAGDAPATIRITDEVLAEPAASPRAMLSALVQSTLARTILGRYDELTADLDRADALASELRAELPLVLDQLAVTRALGLHFFDLAAAVDVAAEGWQRAAGEGGATAILSNAIALVELDRGRLGASVAAARRGLIELQAFDPFRNEQVMLATLSLGLALQGEIGEAERWAALAGATDTMEPRTRAFADRALAWRLSADNLRAAAELAIAGGERAVSGSHVTWGSLLYHDAARLGCPDLVLEPLARLARETTAPLVDLMARHADAAAARDPHLLAGLAADFLVRGSPLLAAEAYAEAADSGPAGPARSRWRATAAHLASFCDGASTPPLAGLTSPLTARELDIANLAVQGFMNREIGERLALSIRTVENHLAAAYRKLGLSGRHELAEVLPSVYV